MESVFDTRWAIFEPEQLIQLKSAFDYAVAQLGPGLAPNTERKLGKVMINLARKRISDGLALDALAVAREALELITQLRSSQWLL